MGGGPRWRVRCSTVLENKVLFNDSDDLLELTMAKILCMRVWIPHKNFLQLYHAWMAEGVGWGSG